MTVNVLCLFFPVPEEDDEKESDESESNDDQVENPDKLSGSYFFISDVVLLLRIFLMRTVRLFPAFSLCMLSHGYLTHRLVEIACLRNCGFLIRL